MWGKIHLYSNASQLGKPTPQKSFKITSDSRVVYCMFPLFSTFIYLFVVHIPESVLFIYRKVQSTIRQHENEYLGCYWLYFVVIVNSRLVITPPTAAVNQ